MFPRIACWLALLLPGSPALAETPPPEAQSTYALLAELRQLRTDLQSAAATIQRVQIVMYRLQTQAAVLERATMRRDQARMGCSQEQTQRKTIESRIELIEGKKRSAQTPAEKTALEDELLNLRASLAEMPTGEHQCQSEAAEAESQFRTEQAKMTELEDQLNKLDLLLAQLGSR